MNQQLCTVAAKPHPFDSDTVYCEFKAGQTIAEMLGPNVSSTASVECGGYPVRRELWSRVRPKAGQILHVVMFPRGGSGGKILRMVAMVVLMYFTMGAGGIAGGSFLGATGATGYILASAAFIVGTLAINALIPPPTPKGLSSNDPFNQLASITGTSNQTSPYGVIPCVVGTKRFFPPHAALPYTEVSGDDQYLRMLLDLGYGDLDVSDIRIGETAIESFEDVEYEISMHPSLFSQDIYELAVGVALTTSSDYAIRTTQTATQEISLDLVFNGGLYGVGGKGESVAGTVQFYLEYRRIGDTTWLPVGDAGGVTATGGLKSLGGNLFSVTSSKRKTLRCGVRWKVASGQYEVKVMRWSSSFPGAQTGASVGDCAWSVLRSVNPQVPSTTGTLKLAVRIKATDQLNGVVQNLSVLASQKIRRWDPDDGWMAPVESANPAWIYLWLMTQCPAVTRRVADSRMDVVGIANWAGECDAKGYKVGFVLDSGRAFGDVLRDVLAAGRASFGLRNGLYSAVRDLPQTVPVQMFTPANSWDFSYSRSFIEPPHALRVKFTNPEANDQQDVRIVYWDGYGAGNATRFEELDLGMVIDPDAAWRLGRYHLAVMWLRPTQYSFRADIEHMVCERGDLIQVAHDITGWGVAWGRIKSVSGKTVTLDGPVALEAGKSYQLRLRNGADGGQVLAAVNTGAGEHQTLALGSAVGAPGDLFVLGEVNRVTSTLVVRAIEPGDDLTATLTCVDASPGIWTADAGTPPAFVSEITGKAWCAPPDPPVATIRAGDSAPDDAGVIHAQTGVSSQPQSGIHRLPSYKQRQLGLLEVA